MTHQLSGRFVLVAGPLLLGAGCGTNYPNDKPNWSLIASAYGLPSGTTSGTLELLPGGKTQTARLTEVDNGDPNLPVQQRPSRNVVWEGVWDTSGDTTTLQLTCQSEDTRNASSVGCTTTALNLMCQLTGAGTSSARLDCGAYKFD